MAPQSQNIFFSPDPIAAVQEFFGPGHESWFTVFSMLGETWGVLVAVGLSMWIWGRDAAYEMFAAVILSVLLKELMNLLVTVPRPSADSIIVYSNLETPSFPSGHVLTAVSMWALLAFERRIWWMVAIVAAILVSLGRLYLGTHYLVDVVVGVAAGVAVAWAVAKVWPALRRWMHDRSYTWAVAGGIAAAFAMIINLIMNSGIPHRWQVTGLALGLVVGFLVERRLLPRGPKRYETGASRARQIAFVAVGLAGIGGCYALSTISGSYALWIDMGATFIAAIWSLVVVQSWAVKSKAGQPTSSAG